MAIKDIGTHVGAATSNGAIAQGVSASILIVEDSATQAAQLQYDLEGAGFQVRIARSGELALQMLQDSTPALVITDVNMPGITGYELCREVKTRAAGLPVMLLTSLSDPLDVIHGLESGADSFTVKPYDAPALLARVVAVLANSQLRTIEPAATAIEIEFSGRRFSIRSDRLQILSLLLSTYEAAVQKNRELAEARDQLRDWNADLERRVDERTAELRTEIQRRVDEQVARRDSEERFHTVVAGMAEGVVVHDRTGRVLFCNAAACQILGLNEQQLLERNTDDASWQMVRADGSILPEDENPVMQILSRGTPQFDRILGVRRGDGKLCWLSCNTQMLQRPDESRASGVVVTFQDITERRNAERQLHMAHETLREREALFHGVLEAAPDAILVTDVAGSIVLANAATTTTFGYAENVRLGMSIRTLIPQVSLVAGSEGETQLVESQSMAASRAVEGRRADGTSVPLEIRHSPLQAGERALSISVIRDVTERRRLEEQLRQSHKMDAVGQLSGGIAHDFNNLLGVILGNLDLLEQQLAGNDAARRRVEIAQQAAERGADLTRRLLAFSRRQQLSAGPVSVRDSASNVIEMARRTVGTHIKVVTLINDALPPVLADAAGLENVLLNLMINSRDAMPDGGTITVAAQVTDLDEDYTGVKAGELRAGRYICISVTDTGKGIPAELLARVFEPFFTTKERDKGTGLGLAMVYGFAKQSGGHATIYSVPGAGTTVSVYLPLAAAAPVKRTPRPEVGGGLIGTALAVDDETDLLEVAVSYLEELGLKVLHAQDGPAALAILEQTPDVDLLVTDVMMPGGMDGVELARRARQLRPDMRVVYSTGYSSAALAEQRGATVDGPVLAKPYRRAEFLGAIRRVFEPAKGNGSL
jgi:PAS domain S-box-containing protein